MERCIRFQAACTNYVDRAVNMYFIRKKRGCEKMHDRKRIHNEQTMDVH